jgi:hypothetical protein
MPEPAPEAVPMSTPPALARAGGSVLPQAEAAPIAGQAAPMNLPPPHSRSRVRRVQENLLVGQAAEINGGMAVTP